MGTRPRGSTVQDTADARTRRVSPTCRQIQHRPSLLSPPLGTTEAIRVFTPRRPLIRGFRVGSRPGTAGVGSAHRTTRPTGRCRSRTQSNPGREPGDIADVCEDPGGAGGPDAGEVHQPRAPLESVPPSTSTPAWPDQRREGSQQVAAYGVGQATLEVEHPPSVPVIVRCVCRGSGAATMLGAVPDEVVGLASGVTPLLPAPPSCWRCPRFRSCAALGGTGLTDLAGVVSGAGTLVCVGLLGGGATLAWLGVPAAEATAR